MNRVATIYVSGAHLAPAAIRTLLALNGISCTEVDVSDDASARELVRARTRQDAFPVIELDGVFATGTSVITIAKALGLSLRASSPPANSPGACC